MQQLKNYSTNTDTRSEKKIARGWKAKETLKKTFPGPPASPGRPQENQGKPMKTNGNQGNPWFSIVSFVFLCFSLIFLGFPTNVGSALPALRGAHEYPGGPRARLAGPMGPEGPRRFFLFSAIFLVVRDLVPSRVGFSFPGSSKSDST